MHINRNSGHLSYCSNIHPGETWQQTFQNLKDYTTQVRNQLTTEPFSIGLRLSNEASLELIKKKNLLSFKDWLADQNMYVCIINGFPYGGFHNQIVKDQVHHPDWTTADRLQYTKRLFDILKELLPEGLDGGVSTSPLSYRFWHGSELEINRVKTEAVKNLIELIEYLHAIKLETGKSMHLDLEPEPDGILETSQEFTDFFNDYLLTAGADFLAKSLDCTQNEARQIIRIHFQLCYDICHFAVEYEKAEDLLRSMVSSNINIGRIQISAALSSGITNSGDDQILSARELEQFDEPTYLHQAVIKTKGGELVRYPDLRPALDAFTTVDMMELRTHFHVPVFTKNYGHLISTQQDIIEVLDLWKLSQFTNHLEVETYTWDVLPKPMRTDIVSSIVRELQWVIDTLDQ